MGNGKSEGIKNNKMIFEEAKKIAVELCRKLQPYCDKINIAGSVRRLKPEVHDIEIICLPKVEPIKDMFGDIIGSERVSEFVSLVNGFGKVIKGKAFDGKMMQIELKNIMLDLFIPDDFDYFRQYAIRTGSRDYSQHTIASGWLKIGWCGSDVGLRKIEDCEGIKQPDGKRKWKCINPNAELPPVWESEAHFFHWIKQPYIKPELRT